MTKWQEFPLRPQGRPWSGINTRSGKLDDGTAQMLDSSLNVIINEGDKLAKRKGMVRGLDERFAGSVCGIHRYTDECGREWLLIADELGFSVRQPFSIPSFAASDAYPSDQFADDGPPNPTYWRNAGGYTQEGGFLRVIDGDDAETDGGEMSWFKDATNFSYEVTMNYLTKGASTVTAIIKKGDVARLEARAIQSLLAEVSIEIVWVNAAGTERVLASESLGSVDSGVFTFSYVRDAGRGVFAVTLMVTPLDGPTFLLQDFTTLNALDDADFGQGTAVRIQNILSATAPGIGSIQGGPL